MVDNNITQKFDVKRASQDFIGYKTNLAVLWLGASNGFGHFATITCILTFTTYDILINETRKLVKTMELLLDSSSLCHTHENDLDTACLDINFPVQATHKNRYELFGQTAECQGCPLLSMVDNVENGTRVKIDTRYGGVMSLSLLEYTESR